MANDARKQTILNAVSLIRSAEQLLVQTSRASSDPVTLMKINTEYGHLDSCLSQLLHTQAISDDADFTAACAALKQQSASLHADETDIRAIVTDVGIAAQIAGYVAQALSFIATL